MQRKSCSRIRAVLRPATPAMDTAPRQGSLRIIAHGPQRRPALAPTRREDVCKASGRPPASRVRRSVRGGRAQLARRRTLKRFLHQHPVRGEQRIHACFAAIKSAVPLTTDAGVMMPTALMAQALCAVAREHSSDCARRSRHGRTGAASSRLCPLRCRARSRPCVSAPPSRRVWGTARALWLRRGEAARRRHRAGDGASWQTILGALAVSVSHVLASNVCGMGDGVDPICLLGASLL